MLTNEPYCKVLPIFLIDFWTPLYIIILGHFFLLLLKAFLTQSHTVSVSLHHSC